MTESWTKAGSGTPAWNGDPVAGTAYEVNTADDILDLLDDTPEDLVVLMHTAGATTLAPLFGDIKGIICTTGNLGSHVAILSREFGTQCILGAVLNADLHGQRVRLDSSGDIFVASQS